jgi:hypothetical protein
VSVTWCRGSCGARFRRHLTPKAKQFIIGIIGLPSVIRRRIEPASGPSPPVCAAKAIDVASDVRLDKSAATRRGKSATKPSRPGQNGLIHAVSVARPQGNTCPCNLGRHPPSSPDGQDRHLLIGNANWRARRGLAAMSFLPGERLAPIFLAVSCPMCAEASRQSTAADQQF